MHIFFDQIPFSGAFQAPRSKIDAVATIMRTSAASLWQLLAGWYGLHFWQYSIHTFDSDRHLSTTVLVNRRYCAIWPPQRWARIPRLRFRLVAKWVDLPMHTVEDHSNVACHAVMDGPRHTLSLPD